MFIDPTIAAVTKPARMKIGDTLTCRGVMGAYVIAINIPDGAGGWQPKTDSFGAAITLGAGGPNELTAFGDTIVQVSKPTTGAVLIGVEHLKADTKRA